MSTKRPFHLIALWQVWEDAPDGPGPRHRPPEALLERWTRPYDRMPQKGLPWLELAAEPDPVMDGAEESHGIGLVVVDDGRWRAMLAQPGWEHGRTRLHRPGGPHLGELTVYGVSPADLAPGGAAWAPAKDYGPKLDDTAAKLREMNGGPPAFEIGPEAPRKAFDEDRPRPRSQPREREF